MLKRILSLVFSVMVYPALSADYLTDDERLYLKKNPMLTVGALKEAWLPYWGGEGAPYSGISHDYALGLSRELGTELKYKFYSTLNELHGGVRKGDVDAIIGLGESTERKQSFLLTDTIYESKRVIWLSDKSLADKPHDNLRWVCVKGSSYCDLVENKGYKSLSIVNTPEAAQEMVMQGLADATVLNYTTLLMSLGKEHLFNGKIVFDKSIENQDYRILMPKNKVVLWDIFNKVIAAEKIGLTEHPINSHNVYSLVEAANYNFPTRDKEQNLVRYTIEDDLFPLSYYDMVDGELKGFVHDLMEMIDSRTVLDIKYVPTNGRDPRQMLKDGAVDILPFQNVLDVDERDFLITDKYSEIEFMHLKTKKEMNKRQLGILDRMGNLYRFIQLGVTFDSVKIYSHFDDLLADLEAGKISEMVINKDLIDQTLFIHFTDNYEVIKPNTSAILKLDIGMRVLSENIILHDLINKVLDTIGSHEIDRLKSMHNRITVNYGIDKSEVLSISIVVLIGFSLILLPLIISYRKVKKAQQEALSAMALRNHFLAVVSHELRNPLAAMLGLMEILSKKITNEDSQLLLKSAINSADSLKHHVNNILDFSKIEAEQLHLDVRRYSLIDELSPLLRNFEANATLKGLDFVLDWEPTPIVYAHIDAMRLNQIVTNLLSNAVKFTDKGKVSVNVFVTENQLLIEVMDTGCGMTPEQKESIYSPFIQADASIARRYGGTGLGMSIVQSLIHLMGGEIYVDSELNKGTCVTVSLPVKGEALVLEPGKNFLYSNDERAESWLSCWGIMCGTQSQGEQCIRYDEQTINFYPDLLFGKWQMLDEAAEDTEHKSRHRRLVGHVLVADDDPINRLLIKRQLSEIGVTSTLVADGQEALKELERDGDKYALLITDCHMPNMDGYALTGQLKRHFWQNKPVIGCTAEDSRIAFSKAEMAGMDTIIFKPYNLDMLYQVLSQYLVNHCEFSPLLNSSTWLEQYMSDEKEEVATVVASALASDINCLISMPSDHKSIAHRVKGSAGVLGLTHLISLAVALEKADSDADVAKHKQQLINEMNIVVAQANSWLQLNSLD
ncbi:ATP-binding protein [Photobacterium nomapromontoriensis]|uniref:ATP-binding protein n=1 Tax=Photobacterium nomapromontoriensis TaxID=2910237 RepID=UPI003D1133FD